MIHILIRNGKKRKKKKKKKKEKKTDQSISMIKLVQKKYTQYRTKSSKLKVYTFESFRGKGDPRFDGICLSIFVFKVLEVKMDFFH